MLPLFEDEERDPPVFVDAERDLLPPLFGVALFDDEDLDAGPVDFLVVEAVRDEPVDLLLLPLLDLLVEEGEEPDLDDEDRPPVEPELFRLGLLDEVERRVPPSPVAVPPEAFPASADWTTLAAPSTAPIAAAVARLPAASAALASKPPLLLLFDDRFDDVLFFDFDLVGAI